MPPDNGKSAEHFLPGVSALNARITRPPEEPKTVWVIGTRERDREIAALLSNLGYEALCGIDGWSRPETARLHRAFAAVVGADLPGAFEVTRVIATARPVILVTRDDSFPLRLSAARAGAAAVLLDPVDMVEMAAWLQEFVAPTNPPLSVLIVDDDELLAATYAVGLEQAGFTATVITEAENVLEEMASASADLVLLDIDMPGADGMEVAQVIRQSRHNLSTPIVFISAERSADVHQQARRLGGDDFIVKPTQLAELAATVRLRAERAVALKRVMERDSLTGLLNHAPFKNRLAFELEHCQRTGSDLTLGMIDIDAFKTVNDSFGHLAGDRVLQTLAHSLVAGLRRIDIVGRYGGEEFGVILLDTPPETGLNVFDKLRGRFSALRIVAGGSRIAVTFSVGVAGGGRVGTGAEVLIAAADRALYAAKQGGRNKVVVDQG
ncbi:MAG: diguanylate cyclase [Cucumibacter sp.]